MSGNTFGTIFRVTTFGESHGEALGAVIDGCPAGIPISQERIQKALDRRRPGQGGPSSTPRKEPDAAEILSGVFNGVSTGTPIAIMIRNTSQLSKDYGNVEHSFRPGHADYTYTEKYGFRDFRGGGRSSGRETASRVAAGAIAQMVIEHILNDNSLLQNNVDSNYIQGCDSQAINSSCNNSDYTQTNNLSNFSLTAYTIEAAGIKCNEKNLSEIEENSLRACDNKAAILMTEKIAEMAKNGDSVGGIVECVVKGLPTGLGEPVFDKLDAELAKAMLSVGAVKGIEFGAGFESARMTGSEWNDQMILKTSITNNDTKTTKPSDLTNNTATNNIMFLSNNAGGILGGISNGNDIVFRVAIKPVPTIFTEQKTVTDNGDEIKLTMKGRHDVCLCPRIVPVIEAMAAITIADMILRQRSSK